MKLSTKEIEVLRFRFNKIKTVEDLVILLNEVRILKFGLKHQRKITLSEFNFFSNEFLDEDKLNKLYTSFEISKKSGGKRLISAPVDRLKFVLSCLDTLLRVVHKPHKRSFGFIDGRSIVDNASFHTNKNYVYNIDLKDFFHSFDKNRIKMALYNEPFNLRGERDIIAYKIACISTYKFENRRVLPQGSPTSPILTNIICWRLDKRLYALSKKFGVEYTRYADDITFSSNHNVYKDDFIVELKRIIGKENLHINPDKTRLQKNNVRQSVTGLIVNSGVNIANEFIKEIRMYLYYCERYGYEKAKAIFLKDFQNDDKDTIIIAPPELSEVLRGKLNYLSMVKDKENSTYLKLEKRFNKLFPSATNQLQRILIKWEHHGIEKAMSLYDELNSKGIRNQEIVNSNYDYLKGNTEKEVVSQPDTLGEFQYFFKTYLNADFPIDSFKQMQGWQYSNDASMQEAYDNYVRNGNQKIVQELVQQDIIIKNKPKDLSDEIWSEFLLFLVKTVDSITSIEISEELLTERLQSFMKKEI